MNIVITKHAIKKHAKKRRNEVNICREIASEMNMSPATAYNYLLLANLVEDGVELLECGQINLSSARKLAHVSKEFQQSLLDKLGKYDIRNYMIKMIRKGNALKDVDNLVKLFKHNDVPPMADIHVHASRKDIIELEKIVQKYIKSNFLRNAKYKTKNMSYNFSCGHSHLGAKMVDIPKILKDRVQEVSVKKKKFISKTTKL